ncbi:MAG: methylated-DNA--[protein]-cysteine S-methyltransferase [Lachnospiraceae bacterium]|nr:methylated-DNA--[protein]-cysteine S-methyltransferase [Lachnospiraceae bacterium]
MRAIYPFRFGVMIIEYEDDVLYRLRSTPEKKEILPEMMGDRSAFSDDVFRQMEELLAGKRKSMDVKYELKGTDFQKKVWRALLAIPYGETRTYKEIAETIGNPAACRAVGMANNRNPLMIIVPCHRVIGSDGSLTGYAGGLPMKQHLLELEKKGKEI